jgi:hypothetical protein
MVSSTCSLISKTRGSSGLTLSMQLTDSIDTDDFGWNKCGELVERRADLSLRDFCGFGLTAAFGAFLNAAFRSWRC